MSSSESNFKLNTSFDESVSKSPVHYESNPSVELKTNHQVIINVADNRDNQRDNQINYDKNSGLSFFYGDYMIHPDDAENKAVNLNLPYSHSYYANVSKLEKHYPILSFILVLFFIASLFFFGVIIASASIRFTQIAGYFLMFQFILVGVCLVLLSFYSNDYSISAMVAQRYKVVSYITILSIVLFGSSISSYLTLYSNRENDMPYLSLLNALGLPFSIYLCMMILIAPLPVVKSTSQMGMSPITDAYKLRWKGPIEDTNSNDYVNRVNANPDQYYEKFGIFDEDLYLLLFMNISYDYLHLSHFVFIGLGYLLGVAILVANLAVNWSSINVWYRYPVLIYMGLGLVFAILFLLSQNIMKEGGRFGMTMEILFLMSHFLSIILFMFSNQGFFPGDVQNL